MGERALHDPALGAQAGTVLGAPAGDQRLHAEVPDEPTVLVVIVATVTTTIVVREPLDPTPAQLLVLHRYANASRACFNFAFGPKHDAHQRWSQGRNRLVAEGMSREEANRTAPKVFTPRGSDVQRIFQVRSQTAMAATVAVPRWT